MAEQMKPSGIDGIGDIPIDWVVTPMKYLVDFYNGDRSENYPSRNEFVFDGIPFINAGHLLNGTLDFENLDYISEEKYKSMGGVKLSKDDIVYCLRGSLGKNALLNIDNGTVASSLVAIRSRNIYPKYLFYIINSHIEETQRLLWDNGTAQPNLSADNLGKFYICVPPVKDQHIIATFLDKQCNRIDGIISDLEKQIETLQKYKKSLILETVTKGLNKNATMKSSGIDWIGNIPAHWDMKPLKYLFDLFAGGDIEEYNVSEEKTEYYKYPIYSNSLENNGLFGYTNKYRFSGHTITVTGRGEVGHALPRYDSYYPIVRLLVGVPKGSINVEYYANCINSTDILGEQTAMAQLTTQKLGVIKVPVPSFEEQEEIGNFLREKNNNINSIIKTKQEQLEKIKQHKKSLIYEYVTGKKRVKEATNGN